MFIRNSMQSHRFIVIVPVTDARAPHNTHSILPWHLLAVSILLATHSQFCRAAVAISPRRANTIYARSGSHFDVFCFSTFNGVFDIFFCLSPSSLLFFGCCVAIYNEMSRRRTRDGKANDSTSTHRAHTHTHSHTWMLWKTFIRRMAEEFKMKWEKCIWCCRCWRTGKYWKLFHACASLSGCVCVSSVCLQLIHHLPVRFWGIALPPASMVICDFVAARNWSNCIEWLTVFNLIAAPSHRLGDFCRRRRQPGKCVGYSIEKVDDKLVHNHRDWVASSDYVLWLEFDLSETPSQPLSGYTLLKL